METDKHLLFECNQYGQERERWRGTIEILKDGMCKYEIIKGYHAASDEIEQETMRYLKGYINNIHKLSKTFGCK